MIAALLAAACIAAYLYAVGLYNSRFPDRAYSAWRIAAFTCGVALMTAMLLPPIEPLADRFFAWHMTQHVVLMLIGPPLHFARRTAAASGCGPAADESRGASPRSRKAAWARACSRR